MTAPGAVSLGDSTDRSRFASIPRFGLFTEEHDALRSTVRDWVARELRSHAEEWEREGDFPARAVVREAGQLGLFGAKYGEDDGGTGPDIVADAVITEELARCGSGGVVATLGAHKDLGPYYVGRFGTSEQRERWLRPAVEGRAIGALAVTEPGAGTDVGGITTRAERASDGDGWVLTGSKMFITNGAIADFAVVAAKTDPDAGNRGVTLFVVDSSLDGYSSSRVETVGWRTSHTGEIRLDGVRVGDDARLGEVNEGFVLIMRNFQWERLAMALGAVAGAEETLRLAMTYADDRTAFGRPVSKFQVWRHRFADMGTEIEAARSLSYHALRMMVAGEDATREVSMAKWYSNDLAWRVADEALQVHGGYGYMMEFPVQRAWRDSRLGPIGGGTTEIMKEVIGRLMGL